MIRKPILFILIAIVAACHSNKKQTLFERLPAEQTGVHFANKLQENDQLNILTYEYFYNGGGVGAGDFNNDGLTDLFFAGNMTGSPLYLNQTKGKNKPIRFEDFTEKSGIKVPGGWARGVALTDINADGYLDIYVCRAGPKQAGLLSNLLFVNQKDNTFKEEGKSYGLDYSGNTTQAAFFDYDRDGDLDVYLVTNVMDYSGPNNIRKKATDGSSANSDKLFRNNGNKTFTDVSREANILIEGYGLGISIVDVNSDGWPDVYVSNDYVSNDLLYINQKDGSFRNEIKDYFRHQSYSAMGNDAADIDNDGLVDFITVDMLPEGNIRRKNMFGLMNYDRHLSELKMGYEPQFMRNTLQHNNGNRPGTRHPFFSETGRYAGIQATDWSWAPLFADYDNDGFRDLMITNGYPKDITNRDFVIYRMAEHQQQMQSGSRDNSRLSKALKQVEGAHIPNYLFGNNHDLTFSDKSAEWGFDIPSFSNGAAYADLDNDGDLDLVMNNIDQEAFIYQNHSDKLPDHHFINLKLTGTKENPFGYGAKVWVYSKENTQYSEHSPYRGYQSTVENTLHFGLGKTTVVDSVRIIWPDEKTQLLVHVKADQFCKLDYKDAAKQIPNAVFDKMVKPLFSELPAKEIPFLHQDELYIDFKIQPLLPHLLSQDGPGIAVGDINGDGLEDFYIGGAFNQSGSFFIQNRDKKFIPKLLETGRKYEEDMAPLLFDADNDGDLDLYIVSGSNEFEAGSPYYQDRLYKNDGKGNFKKDPDALPAVTGSGSTVNAADFDRDGDLDLFVGGRLSPGQYPLAGESYILRNDNGKFTDATAVVCPDIRNAGIVTSAIWSDFDQDGWTDLIVTGEWMPVIFFKNNKGKLENVTKGTGLTGMHGWWNSIASGDFDEDGDFDYVVGNVGLNTEGHPSQDKPLTLFAKDFDRSGTMDPVLCRYFGNELYPVHPRDEMTSQMNFLKKRFIYYADYSKADIGKVFSKEELKDAKKMVCEAMQSVLIINKGNGKFEVKPLPAAAQLGSVYGICAADYNHDGHLDLLLSGNTYATESISGRLDAFSGLLLTGNGKGDFTPVKAAESGFLVEGDGKGLAEITTGKQGLMILAAQNNAALRSFADQVPASMLLIEPESHDAWLEASYANGKTMQYELHYGTGYLSQSTRKIFIPRKGLRNVRVTGFNGKSRPVGF
ncbi:VCBS repeat-containing protein [Dyadobacter flavalbus]|uniref:VCBS repeat-containing protein n=1 Tax=Dyadobacter flavalbus TaxID=2579942 RepID=A0A5M8QVW5_9BACT|nr:VCBS repeat-containing protein [Dyadobacter flavalbus]KAA6438212.1 VCBS repeat-containing protein [Dyadobacter flavalbus]